ncbi:MAG: hypothetical protein ABIQ13_11690, partial [Pedococcus sp.]
MSTNPLLLARESRQLALWERTAAVAGRLNRAQAELVQTAAELITDRHWGDGGFKTPKHYLVVRAGCPPGTPRTSCRSRNDAPSSPRRLPPWMPVSCRWT